jgi:hypothetical protein
VETWDEAEKRVTEEGEARDKRRKEFCDLLDQWTEMVHVDYLGATSTPAGHALQDALEKAAGL